MQAVDVRLIRDVDLLAGGVGVGLGDGLGEVLGQVPDRAVGVGAAAVDALDVDLRQPSWLATTARTASRSGVM